MAKTPRLSKSGIEYFNGADGSPGYAWNFYSGCHHQEQGVCPPISCWARTITERFHDHYPNGFEPTFYQEAYLSPIGKKKPSRIGVCFMGDLFGDWVDPNMVNLDNDDKIPEDITLKQHIFKIAEVCPRHTFVFLTKNPAGMIPWSPFPDNCEVGFSATTPEEFAKRLVDIGNVQAKVKWCSLEPLLNWSTDFKTDAWRMLDWVAIGALTGTERKLREVESRYPNLTPFNIERAHWGLMPPLAWLKSIVEQLDACGTKVFIKDNLHEWLYANKYYEPIFIQRQEYGAREGK